MFDIFGQPWTLLGIAVIVLFGILTFRSIVPEKRHWWQWLIPTFIAIAAFGIDNLVITDIEKIHTVINIGIKAIEEEDLDAIKLYIADDYQDSLHNSKEQLITHIEREVSGNVIKKNKKTNLYFEKFTENEAKVNLFMLTTFKQDSYITQVYALSFIQMKIDINFKKQNNQWLINQIEIRKVNQQSVSWNQIR